MRVRYAAFLLALLPIWAQQPPVFHAESSLALVRFHVARNNTYVSNLKSEDIQLLEDGRPRPFTVFEPGGITKRNRPVDLVLLFDYSCSMLQTGRFDPSVFKTNLLDGMDNVRLAVYGFGRELHRYCRPTREMAVFDPALRSLIKRQKINEIKLQLPPKRTGKSDTWLYEAVIATAQDAMPRPDVHSEITFNSPKAAAAAEISEGNIMMMVFSDGNPSTTSVPEDAAGVCQKLGVPVYPVVLCHQRLLDQIKQVQENGRDKQGNFTEFANTRMMELRVLQKQIQDFARLGELTGGRSFDSPEVSMDIMRQILSFMVGQVRNQYVVGFVPEKSFPPHPHKLEVRLADKQIGKVFGGTRIVVH